MPMSTGTKRILAIVVVAVVVVAGVGVYLMVTPSGPRYEVPGAPDGTPSSQWIKVGVLDPMTAIQGIGSYQGSKLAAYEINKAGGIVINGTHYYFALISEDTFEADALLDTTKGVAAAQKIITVDGAQFLTGGFRTEALRAYIETVMDKKILFIGTGSSTDDFCKNVINSYARYKYFFRIQPINSTALGASAIYELAYLKAVLAAMTGTVIHKWAILREDLDWTVPMELALLAKMNSSLHYDTLPTDNIAFPQTATSTDFAGYMNTIQSHGAQIVIPIISAGGGALMMAAYNTTAPKFMIFGIDVPSQLDTFWNDTSGAAMYEMGLQTVVYTNKTALTKPFIDHYKGNFTTGPLYTSVGGYDAINTLAYAINLTQSFNNDKIITAMEGINKTHTRIGPGGVLAFGVNSLNQPTHDLVFGPGFGVPLFTQWQSGGFKACIGSPLYPASIVTASVKIPPQGLNPY